MSIIKPIDMTSFQDAIEAVLSGKVDRIEWTRSLNLKIETDGTQATLKVTDGTVEVDIPGPWSPDMVEVTANRDGTGKIRMSVQGIPFRWKR